MSKELDNFIASMEILFVRISPFVLMGITMLYYIATMCAYFTDSYTVYFNIEGQINHFSWDIWLNNTFLGHFKHHIFALIPLWILSGRLRFCWYHKIAIIYLALNAILTDQFQSILTDENTIIYVSGGLIFMALSIVAIVWAYLKRDRSKR